MENKRDVMDDLQGFILDLIKGKTPTLTEFSTKEKERLSIMSASVRFLTRFETNDAFKSQVNVDNIFKDGYLYTESFHEGTEAYNKKVIEYPAIKNLENYQTFYSDSIDLGRKSIAGEEVIVKEDRIIHLFTRIKPIAKYEQKVAFSAIPKENFYHFDNLKGVVKSKEGFIVPEEYYYLHDFDKMSKNDKPCKVLVKVFDDRLECYRLDDAGVEGENNFFTDRLFKLYTEDGEIEDYDSVDYLQVFEQIRHCIAHNGLKSYLLDENLKLIVGKLEIDKDTDNPKVYAIVFLQDWFELLILLNPQKIQSCFRFISIPKFNKPITDKETLNQLLESSKVIKIQMDSYGTTAGAFQDFIEEYIRKYKNDDKIKKPIDEYLTSVIEKYYEGFKVEVFDLKNLELMKNRVLCDTDFLDMKPDKDNSAAVRQRKSLESFANDYYVDCLDTDEVFNAVDYAYPNTFASNYIRAFFKDFLECSTPKKAKNIRVTTCGRFETMVAFCQLLIFYRLIYNNSYDFWKTIEKPQKIDLSYYDTEEGKALLKIEDLDMSAFSLLHKKNANRVGSFDDRLTVLRLLRNAIGHGSVKYIIDGNPNVLETRLIVTSLTRPDLSVSVKCKHLIEFLNQPFFKNQSVPNYARVEVTRDNIEEEMKKFLKN